MTGPQWNRLHFPSLLLTFLLAIPAVAFSAGPIEQKPCADEIEKFCGDARPGEGRIVKCLREHDRELSAVCRDKVKIALKRLEEAKQACAKDSGKLCADVTPGGGRLAKCLKRHLNELTPACREKLGPIKGAVLIGTLLVTAAEPVKPAYSQDENITVSCYKGNLDEGNYIGDLTVTTPENAGQDCNSLYYDCQGGCLGCFPDSEFTEDVCYDNEGRKFLK